MNLKLIQKPVADTLIQTDQILKNAVGNNAGFVKEVAGFIPVTKGKKIRSTLLFLLLGMSDKKFELSPTIAASVELFHISSLIHDDILDSAEQRRGATTLNHNFGNLISVLGGDFLFISSLELMNSLADKNFLSILISSTKKMIEGQLLEIQNNFNFDSKEKIYMEIIEKKTSALFAGVTMMASHIIDGSEESLKEYYEFGINFGNIFQLSDDLLDIFSDKSGKDRFRDLQEGKITLPYIILKERYGERIEDLFSAEDKDELLRKIEEYDVETEVNKRVDYYYEKCIDFVKKFKQSQYSESLFRLLDFIKKREF